jgi:hypothetical protein
MKVIFILAGMLFLFAIGGLTHILSYLNLKLKT